MLAMARGHVTIGQNLQKNVAFQCLCTYWSCSHYNQIRFCVVGDMDGNS